ncbi:MAG: CHAD domain-containing protein [Actinomycetota bacterium]|nr:CHAD domain-containing protein [Actinomycetota bacterium]
MTAPAPRPTPRRQGLLPTDIAEALSSVLSVSTAAIRDNEPGSRHGEDIEHVHRMRVATRRIRAYLRAARPALDSGAALRLRSDLAGLAGALGRVRDLDVMMDRMHSEATALGEPDTAALERLTAVLDTDRRAARAALIAELDGPGFATMLAELDAAIADPPVTDPWADLRQLAGLEWDRLARARAKLVTASGDEPADDELHALRILGKRARYSAELLTGRPGRGPSTTAAVKRFLLALADFQEVLGSHQDACVLEDQLREMVAAPGSAGRRADGKPAAVAAALAAGRVIEGCRRRRSAARLAYPPAWAAVAKAAAKAFG